MTIIVGFSRPKKWKPFAWLIMKAYGIDYDHAYVKFHSNTYDRDVIYQASSTMVNFMSNKLFEENNIVVAEYQVPITDEKNRQMIQFAMDNAGAPYGIASIFGLAYVRLCELMGKKVRNPFADGGKTYVCCELVSYLLEQNGAVGMTAQDDVNPKELRAEMDKRYLVLNLAHAVNGGA